MTRKRYRSSDPPAALEQAKAEVRNHPDVARVGLTMTEDGRWALMVWPREGVEPPIGDLDRLFTDYPIVYESEPPNLPIARPAYPSKGE